MNHRNGFLNVQNLYQQWKPDLASTFNTEDKYFLQIAIAEAYAVTTHSRIRKTSKAVTEKFEYQSFLWLVKEYVISCNMCQKMKYLYRGPIEYVTYLHMPVMPWSDNTIDILKLSPVLMKSSPLYQNIPVGEDHIVCISWLWTIVNRQSGLNFLISVPDSFSIEHCTATFDIRVVPTMGYYYYIGFDSETLFMSLHFQNWAASKGIKLEPSTTYQP